jgi:hypothetical protein
MVNVDDLAKPVHPVAFSTRTGAGGFRFSAAHDHGGGRDAGAHSGAAPPIPGWTERCLPLPVIG